MLDLKSIRAIGNLADMPPAQMIYGWIIDQDHPFYELHRTAREMQSWVWVDVLQDLVPAILNRSVCPRRVRLAFKVIIWLCERFNPAVFKRKAGATNNADNRQSGITLSEESNYLKK